VLTQEFDYQLPDELIAQRPAPRGESRLLVLDARGAERHRHIRDLPELLAPGDLLVVNDTRVLPVRLLARRRPGGGQVEVLLAERRDDLAWEALVRPGRRARPGTVLELASGLTAEIVDHAGNGKHTVRFSEPVEPLLERIGHVPLPPYIKRPDEPADRERYQTVYARRPGAIAAPTAGLHFSAELLARLEARGIRRAAVTLHVGLGTFKPVTAELVHEHHVDAERFEIPEETVAAVAEARARGGRVVAVGTTVVRTLEGALAEGSGTTDLFVYPGFDFQAVDLLLTNFHLPRSTLLMLVCAFAGTERVLAAYREAVERGYRFYSYGDAMLASRLR
jgi:S-adenosylmethionine:tRNA ribosyltransferase-isomerase